MMHKRIFAGFTAMALTAALLTGCGSAQTNDTEKAAAADTGSAVQTAQTEQTDINVFAAASMQETLTKLANEYMDEHSDVNIQLNLDSSGTLKTQIEEGADCDLFISAAQKQMNELADEDYVNDSTRVDLLENKVVLVVPKDNPKDIQSFQDIADKADLIALGNEDVPVGQYSEEILTNLNILDKLEQDGKITYGSNVKEVTTQVAEGAVDCGIVYETDAFSAGLDYVDEAGTDLCKQAIYPAAVMSSSKNEQAAQEFLNYLESEHAGEVFESVGFAFLMK